jgi:hypothetical protein
MIWLWIGGAAVLTLALAVVLGPSLTSPRAKMAGIHCPQCGRCLGREARVTAFTRQLDPCPPGALLAGFEVICGHCRAQCVFTRDSRFVGLGTAKDHLRMPTRRQSRDDDQIPLTEKPARHG